MADKVVENVAWFGTTDQVDEPGFYTLTGEVETDANGVEHHTNMTPDRLVFASPDGEGFVYDKPEEGGE
jgi:hypothetical protein